MYTQNYLWPSGIQALGWLIPLTSTIMIPIIGMYQVWTRHRQGEPLGLALFRTTPDWKAAQEAPVSVTDVDEVKIRSTIQFQRSISRSESRRSFRRHISMK